MLSHFLKLNTPILWILLDLTVMSWCLLEFVFAIKSGEIRGKHGVTHNRSSAPIGFALNAIQLVIVFLFTVFIFALLVYLSRVNTCFEWKKTYQEIKACQKVYGS